MTKIFRWIPAMTVVGLLFMSADISAQQTFSTDELVQPPSFESAQQAHGAITRSYPIDLQDARIGGTVLVRFIVDADGKVSPHSVDIIAASSSELGEAAARAVTSIQFVPGQRDGTAASTLVEMPIRYLIQ